MGAGGGRFDTFLPYKLIMVFVRFLSSKITYKLPSKYNYHKVGYKFTLIVALVQPKTLFKHPRSSEAEHSAFNGRVGISKFSGGTKYEAVELELQLHSKWLT